MNNMTGNVGKLENTKEDMAKFETKIGKSQIYGRERIKRRSCCTGQSAKFRVR